MDRNSIIGFVLILLIMVGYFFITQDNVSDLEARKQREKDSIAKLDAAVKTDSGPRTDTLKTQTAQTAIAADSTDTAKKEVYTGPFGRFASGTEELVTIENDVIKVKLSTKGGHPYSVELKEYNRSIRTEKGGKSDQPVVLFEGAESKFNISFATADGFTDSTSRLYFTPSAKNVDATKDSGTVSLKVSLDENQYLEQVYWLKPGSYELFYTIRVKGLNKLISPNLRFLQLDWKVTMPLQEHDVEQERDVSTVYYREEGLSPDYISEKSYEEKKAETNLEWVAFKQKFFNSTLIGLGDVSFGGAKVSTQKSFESTHVKTVTFSSIVSLTPNNEETLPMKFYFGPNKYNLLKKLDNEMDALVPMGWGIFGWINKGMILPLFNLLTKVTGNFGLIILIMTLIIKALLFGLVYKSYLSSAKMRILKPEIDELKEKHGSDLQKFQQEQMSLFKRAGVSPLGGCLPLLLQMPFLIALFQFFPASIELRHESLLWATDLSTYDSIWSFGKVPVIDSIYGDHVSLFTLLMTISTLVYTMFNNQLTGVSGQMKYMGYIMPIFFLGFFNNYAAGLTYYYFLTNVVSIAQQFIIRRFVDEDALHRKIQENKKKPVKKSAFQQRLEEMAKKRGVDPKKLKR